MAKTLMLCEIWVLRHLGEKRVVRGLRRKEGLRKFAFGSELEEGRGRNQRFAGRIVDGWRDFGGQESL